MTTLGQQILSRLDALETAITDVQLGTAAGDGNGWARMDELRNQMRAEMTALRERLDAYDRAPEGARGENSGGIHRSLLNPKDCMPPVLSANYKTLWRTWSYKTRDWLGQLEPGLSAKLEKVERETKELSPEFIAELNLAPKTDDGI